MRRFTRPVIVIILIILLACFIPAITKGMRISKLQKQLENYKVEYARCEQVLVNSHSWAEAVRSKLNEELGISVFLSGAYMPQTQSQTATWASVLLDQYIE